MAERGVIIYMSRMRDIPLLYRSLSMLCWNFKYVKDYPIIVFHDDIDKATVANLMVSLHKTVGFIPNIKFELLKFEMPDWVSTDPSKYTVSLNEFWMGYRHMCRFHSGGIYRDPRLAEYDYYWRLDSDSYLYSPIDFDPFERMKNENYEYAFMCDEDREVPRVAEGLWDTTLEFMQNHNIQMPEFMKNRLVDGTWNHDLFYTNFEIAKFSFFRSPEYMAYFDHLDKTGNIYYKRWGDAPIHWLGVRMLMSPEKVWAVKDITYQHNNWLKNLNALPNKKIAQNVYDMIDGDEKIPNSRKGRFAYGMSRYLNGGPDGLNWGD
jgi:hypothetical protein